MKRLIAFCMILGLLTSVSTAPGSHQSSDYRGLAGVNPSSSAALSVAKWFGAARKEETVLTTSAVGRLIFLITTGIAGGGFMYKTLKDRRKKKEGEARRARALTEQRMAQIATRLHTLPSGPTSPVAFSPDQFAPQAHSAH